MNMIYLDHNATAPIHPQVVEVMARAAVDHRGNPASQHAAGRRARQALEDAREAIAAMLGMSLAGTRGDRLIFTSGGTESNHLALLGLTRPEMGQALVSAIEHSSVLGAGRLLAERGTPVETLSVDRHGVARLDELAERLKTRTQLVSVMLANHETGVAQPLDRVVELAHAAGAIAHTDATQAVGKIDVDFRVLGVEAMTFTAHKLHGPVGIGGLALSSRARPRAIMRGGAQQEETRPGTEGVALACGFRAAMEIWHADRAAHAARMRELRERFERELRAACADVVIHGHTAARLPHTTNAAFVGCDRQSLVVALDLAGVACSTGSACASGSSEPSHVLLAMGCSQDEIDGSLRFSLGQTTTADEVRLAVERISKVVNTLRDGKRTRKTVPSPRGEG